VEIGVKNCVVSWVGRRSGVYVVGTERTRQLEREGFKGKAERMGKGGFSGRIGKGVWEASRMEKVKLVEGWNQHETKKKRTVVC